MLFHTKQTLGWLHLSFWHWWHSRPSSSHISLWLASRWQPAEYGLTWLSSTWSSASRALSCTEVSESATAGTTPCSHAFCTTLHSGLTWQRDVRVRSHPRSLQWPSHQHVAPLTLSRSPTHCRAFFFTDTDGSLQRSDKVWRVSQLMGITSCFRRPSRACAGRAHKSAWEHADIQPTPTRNDFNLNRGCCWLCSAPGTCNAAFLTLVFESFTRRRRRAKFSFAASNTETMWFTDLQGPDHEKHMNENKHVTKVI